MRTKNFWLDTLERAVKTFAQALIAVIAVGTPIYEIDWLPGLGIAATATAVSVLTSIASAGAGAPDSASLVGGGRHRQVG
ncbi:holin [Corynebacterium phocae]|uniref:Holin n=1 Tax=Corynebacterium phocae TaxID=161895 RepID=A0A1L7D3I2_9CORY|nr:holin [Corynebacterium phocae]APT92684.1 holin [Corynebacterium phocae]KAA8723572.1 holin [Corynebacterium phocae]